MCVPLFPSQLTQVTYKASIVDVLVPVGHDVGGVWGGPEVGHRAGL